MPRVAAARLVALVVCCRLVAEPQLFVFWVAVFGQRFLGVAHRLRVWSSREFIRAACRADPVIFCRVAPLAEKFPGVAEGWRGFARARSVRVVSARELARAAGNAQRIIFSGASVAADV